MHRGREAVPISADATARWRPRRSCRSTWRKRTRGDVDADADASVEAATALGHGRGATPTIARRLGVGRSHARPRSRAELRTPMHGWRGWATGSSTGLSPGRVWKPPPPDHLHGIGGHADWLRTRLKEIIRATPTAADERIGVFTGPTSRRRRERIKRAFNGIPDKSRCASCWRPMPRARASTCRPGATTSCISICRGTRRGWSSATAASTASCSRRRRSPAAISSMRSGPEDVVLEALVRKTETIRASSARLGQVIGIALPETRTRRASRDADAERSPTRSRARTAASAVQVARREMDDE